MFRRISKSLRQYLGLTSDEGEPTDAESVLQRQKELFGEQIARYNRSLAASAGLCELLRSQIKQAEGHEQSLRLNLETHAKNGASEAAGGEVALRWETARNDLKALREQLQHAQATHDDVALARDAAIQAARKQFAELKGTLSEHQIQQVLAEVLKGQRPG